MKFLALYFVAFLFMSCSGDDANNNAPMDVNFELSVRDNSNVDLLSPDVANTLNTSQIKLFYLIQGESIEVNNPSLDHPRNYFIFQHESEYRIRIFLNNETSEQQPVTYIKWNELDTDTIKVQYAANRTKDKVWVNNELVWQSSENQPGYYSVVK